MTQEDELDLKGLRAELVFVKGTLDKLGVDMEFEHVGKYKDAPDMFTRTSPTPETLEVTNAILDQYYGNLIDTIRAGPEQKASGSARSSRQRTVRRKEALDGGLVDALLYEDEVYGKLKEQIKVDTTRIADQDYLHSPFKGTEGPNKIAYIVGDGDITRVAPTLTEANPASPRSAWLRRCARWETILQSKA